MEGLFSSGDDRLNYEWGRLFASSWNDVGSEMASRAAAAGLTQRESARQLSWMREGSVVVRFVFIEDPSNFNTVGRIFADESNAPSGYATLVIGRVAQQNRETLDIESSVAEDELRVRS